MDDESEPITYEKLMAMYSLVKPKRPVFKPLSIIDGMIHAYAADNKIMVSVEFLEALKRVISTTTAESVSPFLGTPVIVDNELPMAQPVFNTRNN